ncbi:MAG: hypothetical protein KF774_04005 [Planctomyces sp.]|nr:hypothetical protein [Planctomyces sp.]
MDDIVQFMDHDGLANRYDHVVMAGAALGALGVPAPGRIQVYPHWQTTFLDHLDAAVSLHGIEDVYIIEHRDCGAYSKLINKTFGTSFEEQRRELRAHRRHARLLGRLIGARKATIKVRAFLMDLRGDVELLDW